MVAFFEANTFQFKSASNFYYQLNRILNYTMKGAIVAICCLLATLGAVFEVSGAELNPKYALAKYKSLVGRFYWEIFDNAPKWTDESKCQVYSDIVKATNGQLSDDEAISKAAKIQDEIDANGVAPKVPALDESSVAAMSEITETLLNLEPNDRVWVSLYECVAQHPDYPSAAALIESPIVKNELDAASHDQSSELPTEQQDLLIDI